MSEPEPIGCDYSIGRFTIEQLAQLRGPSRVISQFPDGGVELGCKLGPRWALSPMGRHSCHNHLPRMLDKIIEQASITTVRVSRFDADCALCDIDRHWCPGCGEPTAHVERDQASACYQCRAEGTISNGR